MAVTPVTPPVPLNSNYARSIFIWGTTDEITSDTNKQNILNWCRDRGINTVYLDIWRFLGGANWTTANKDNVAEFIDAAHKSGIEVYAMAGNVDWAVNQAWVNKNVIWPIQKYNAMHNASFPKSRFDGIVLDVEYWTDEVTYPPATNLPGLCDLVKSIQTKTNLPVGVFSAFYLKDNTGTRPNITYNGKTAQDGEHLMDTCDFVVVGAYRDTANTNPGNGQPGQIQLFQPWYDYAKTVGKNLSLYCGLETINVLPDYITYYSQTRTFMEGEQTTISNQFQVMTDSVFLGAAIHDYLGHKAMPA